MDSLRSRDEMATAERGTKTSCVEPGEEVKEKEGTGLVFPIFVTHVLLQVVVQIS